MIQAEKIDLLKSHIAELNSQLKENTEKAANAPDAHIYVILANQAVIMDGIVEIMEELREWSVCEPPSAPEEKK